MATPEEANEMELAALLHSIGRPVTVMRVNLDMAEKLKVTRKLNENGDLVYSFVRKDAGET